MVTLSNIRLDERRNAAFTGFHAVGDYIELDGLTQENTFRNKEAVGAFEVVLEMGKAHHSEGLQLLGIDGRRLRRLNCPAEFTLFTHGIPFGNVPVRSIGSTMQLDYELPRIILAENGLTMYGASDVAKRV